MAEARGPGRPPRALRLHDDQDQPAPAQSRPGTPCGGTARLETRHDQLGPCIREPGQPRPEPRSRGAGGGRRVPRRRDLLHDMIRLRRGFLLRPRGARGQPQCPPGRRPYPEGVPPAVAELSCCMVRPRGHDRGQRSDDRPGIFDLAWRSSPGGGELRCRRVCRHRSLLVHRQHHLHPARSRQPDLSTAEVPDNTRQRPSICTATWPGDLATRVPSLRYRSRRLPVIAVITRSRAIETRSTNRHGEGSDIAENADRPHATDDTASPRTPFDPPVAREPLR